ncbi:TonB family protein [Oleiharenicola lentus]|jgi:TonB family protein|uniref:TonB family protein n=1 Tax=Oleiharenicola lentus TaxID=2508720 RepID=A0A4V1M5X5_9BACT|nr:TonB family protein [Oleiharenicola lentus]
MNKCAQPLLGAFLILASLVSALAKPLPASEADVGVAINQTTVLVYPPRMLYEAIYSGEARVVISVDADGDLTDCLVTGYTHKVFAEAAVDALKRWRFEPARARGIARAARTEVQFLFRDRGVIVQNLPGAMEQRMILGELRERYTFSPCKLSELDRIPNPVHVVSPVVPRTSRERHVTVAFYIDPEGRVRMPAVERDAADDEYAAAAVAAVEQWRFESPLRKGQPVLVYAEQEFKFQPK